jgi:hypothetical protein
MQFSHLGKFLNNEEVLIAVRERLRTQEPVFYGDDLVVKVVLKWDRCLKVIGGKITKNNYTSAGQISYILHRNDS